MTIEEAIAHAREVAEKRRKDNDNCKYKKQYGCKGCVDYYSKSCIECADECEQLADWFEELSRRRVEELFRKTDEKAIRDKAIDDFSYLLRKAFDETNIKEYGFYPNNLVKEIAEQLKVGGSNDN